MRIECRWWLPLLAAGLSVAAGVRGAAAQTIVVKDVAPGSAVEIVANTTQVAEATADEEGSATLELDVRAAFGQPSVDAQVLIDTCAGLRRILLVERAQPLAAGGACARTAIADFRIAPDTTLLVELGGAAPVVRIRQGPLPPLWLLEPAAAAASTQVLVPTGLVLSGALAISRLADASPSACGDAPFCFPEGARAGAAGGVTYWFTPFFGADLSFWRPSRVNTRGAEFTYSFENDLDVRVATIAAKVAGPIRRARLYALAGVSRHWAMSTSSQVAEVREGGENGQLVERRWESAFRTVGWGWVFGGGAEVWPISRVAVYTEVAVVPIDGAAVDGNGARIEDRLTSVTAGVRLRVGR